MNKIIIKKSSVSAKIPALTDLDYGELALNYTDGIIYYKNSNNTIQPLNNTSTGSNPDSSVIDTPNTLVLRSSTGAITGQSFLINKGNSTYGTISWNSTEATYDMSLDSGVVLQAGQELHYYGRAVGAIANGDVVMFAGVQGDNVLITKADASAVGFQAKWVMGIATQSIANNEWGYVTAYGKVRGINTTAYTAGAILYFDPANPGKLTAIEPTSPNPKITIAAVLRSANDGILLIRPDFTHKLDNLQNVNISTPSNKDFLVYNSATSSWVNNAVYSTNNSWTNNNSFTTSSSSPTVTITNSNTGYGLSVDKALATTITLNNITSTTSTNTVLSTITVNQVLDSFSSTLYRSAKYIIQATASTSYNIIEVLLIHDGTTVTIMPYGEVYTTTSLITLDADISAGNVRLLVTPNTPDTTIKLTRTIFSV